ncbi:hypothetical protein CVIRNUC_007146 [Coccomyxa viridis]|uniref:Protein-lysine N-methyltransferase CVIRNUC_007146 n=1 Tax=Coccomyxa viridis TaxID=1274662 RepID=A0AAV1IDH2_9CHLO|nr:hypothetical protein CVIRNUC_007146 [Coccomyxa viridis]
MSTSSSSTQPINIRRSIDEGHGADGSETPALSRDTLAALNEFLSEAQAAASEQSNPFSENWGLSQFWYTEETAAVLAKEVEEAAGPSGRIACIACPSLFRQLRAAHPDASAHLLEFDPRFEALGNFALYDYREPRAVPEDLKGAFRVVVADPPYLSEECLRKTLETVKVLAEPSDEGPGLYLLTGATMQKLAKQLLNLRPTKFRPQHKTKLGNEFYLYASADAAAQRLGGWDGGG